MEQLKNKVKKIYFTSLISSILILVLGILVLARPDFILNTVSTIIGGIVLIPGIISLVDYFKNKYTPNLVVGVIACILSFVFIFNSKFISSILPFVLGIYFIIDGIRKLQYALELKKNRVTSYMTSVITSILILTCGVLMIVNPFGGALAITQVIGIFMIVYAILDIYNAVMMKKGIQMIVKELKK